VITVRLQQPDDAADVRYVNERAFGQRLEADLVEALQRACAEAVSLVAEDDGIVGHILFTPVTIERGERPIVGMGLAPMAVLPERQRQGIGTSLVTHGLEFLRQQRCPFVVVVGHPEYYPRFGFARASMHGLSSQWEGIPDPAFMVLVLEAAVMTGVSGVARYRPEFDEVG
jgi:putative acetyltransferase